MKKTPALIASFVMTVIVGIIMVAVSANALATPTTSAAANAGSATTGSSVDAAQLQQLQATIANYQSREQQYQAQLQQYQQLFQSLQRAGVISVDANGQITLPNRSNNTRGNR